MSHLGTSDYTSTFTTTCDFTPGLLQLLPIGLMTSHFTPGHLPLPTQFQHHSQFHTEAHLISHPHLSQFHTWAPLITPLLYRSFPISYLGTSYYPSNFTTIPNFPHGHISLPTHCTSGHLPTLPLSISQLDTSDHPPTFYATSNFTCRHFWSPPASPSPLI